MIGRTLAATVRILQLEGWRAVLDRAADRRRDAAWLRDLAAGPAAPPGGTGVLNLLATAPAVRLGGVQVQLQARLAVEAAERPVALLFRAGPQWRLVRPGGARGGEPGGAVVDDGPQAGESLRAAVHAAMGRLGARAICVENVAGLSLAGLLALARDGVRLILQAHDFALFCPRPHLIEAPHGAFCGYSTDPARCAACLAHGRVAAPDSLPERRAIARELLAAADAVVYPSEFARTAHLGLFAGLDATRHLVIPPAAPRLAGAETPARPPGPCRRVAFLGPAKPHKGGAVIAEVARLLAATASPRPRLRIYGGGDPGLLAPLRRLPGVEMRGSYCAGALPALLVRDGIDLALVLSIWPETHALVLDECAAAGVSVVVFDLGAQAARVRELGLGETVALARGPAGIAEVVTRLAGRPRRPTVEPDVRRRLAVPADAARAHLELLRRLGLL